MKFNEKQIEIINALKGQVLVVACPGSGKTTTMLARTNALVESGVNPDSILVMTFTKAAATHMESKFRAEYGSNSVSFNTIHAVCFKVLQNEKGYTVKDLISEIEKWEFFYKILRGKVPYSEMEDFVKDLLLEISYMKNKMTPVTDYKPEVCNKETFQQLYEAYETYKSSEGKVDFDDMLLLTRTIFLNEPDTLKKYRRMWEHIMVDEFQDTNTVQSDIIYALAGKDGNLCVVGDDDQSIYGFRSADSSIMLDFAKSFPNAKTYYLDTNYRSKSEIVERAAKLIANNKVRFNKDFKAFRGKGAEILLDSYTSQAEQCDGILKKVIKLAKDGESADESAVLYRTNAQNQMLAAKLIKENIEFYTTETVKDPHGETAFLDIRAYYRLANGIEEKGDLQRILNRPSRYLKSEPFKDCPFDLDEALYRCEIQKNPELSKKNVRQMFKDINHLRGLGPERFIKYLYKQMKYDEAYVKYQEFIGKDKKDAEFILDFLEDEAGDFDTMSEWLSYAENYAKELAKKKKQKKGICLSTYHSAKGLEWKHVFLMDTNDRITPYTKAETPEELEEERRLFYVAFTRAKDNVYISWVQKDGSKFSPSPYLKEMGFSIKADKPSKGTVNKTISNSGVEAYYAVKVGKKPGVYANWEACQKQIAGYPDCEYKKFDTYSAAKAYLEGGTSQKPKVYYAYKTRKQSGICTTWEECKRYVDGQPGAKYKKFSSEIDAQRFIS